MAKEKRDPLVETAKELLDKFQPIADHPRQLARQLRETAGRRGSPGYPAMSDDDYKQLNETARQLEELADDQQ